VKDYYRKQIIEKRKEIRIDQKDEADFKLTQKIQKDPRYQASTIIGLFYPMTHEINLLSLLNQDKTFVFPKVEGKDIHFYPKCDDTLFIKSAFGVMEPLGQHIMDQQIDYLIVPALVISKNGYRIGYGKGFYDRFLLKHRPKHVIGVIYSFQEIDDFEVHDFDQKVDDYFKVNI